jgi:hypothetical protein
MQLTIMPFVAVVVISWAAVPALTRAAEPPAGAGVWPANYTPEPTNCGAFEADGQGFCVADDSPLGVELGVKFDAAKPVLLTGVRIYRVVLSDDEPTVTGSLWNASGNLLRSSTDGGYQEASGWADLVFDEPFLIDDFDVGETFVASYYSPGATYAFEYHFFSSGPFTNGPITAHQSLSADGNGVYCYDNQSCFPVDTYRDTNYWVTPLWAYDFDGFYQPVDSDTWNMAKAGQVIPVKFSLGADLGLEILKAGFPKASPIACEEGGASINEIEVESATTAGGSGLTYDADADQYVYAWKTRKQWAGRCYEFDLGLNDDTSHTFKVSFRR